MFHVFLVNSVLDWCKKYVVFLLNFVSNEEIQDALKNNLKYF